MSHLLTLIWVLLLCAIAVGVAAGILTISTAGHARVIDFAASGLLLILAYGAFRRKKLALYISLILALVCLIIDGAALVKTRELRYIPGVIIAAFGIIFFIFTRNQTTDA